MMIQLQHCVRNLLLEILKLKNKNQPIRVITKLPNSEQSYKGKVKTHNYINRQNQSTTGKLWNCDPDLVQAFLKEWWVESDFKAPNLPLSIRLKVSGCHYNSMITCHRNFIIPRSTGRGVHCFTSVCPFVPRCS